MEGSAWPAPPEHASKRGTSWRGAGADVPAAMRHGAVTHLGHQALKILHRRVLPMRGASGSSCPCVVTEQWRGQRALHVYRVFHRDRGTQ